MKLAFLSFYSGQIDRGVEVATAALARGLSKNHDVTLFQAGGRITPGVNTVQLDVEKAWPEDSSSSFLRPIYFDHYSRKILSFTRHFLPYFDKHLYDVIVATNGGWQVALLRIMTKVKGKKLILQGNAGIGRDDLWQLTWHPDHFIAISPQGYTWAKEKTSSVPVTYIPYGVDTELFKRAKPKDLKVKKPIVLCVGAFLPYKQVDLLIRGMEKVPEAHLVMVGLGPEEHNLRKLAQKLLGDRWTMFTDIKHDELPAFYRAASVFSLPSKSSEALGIVNIEAMAAGLPVVCPDDFNRRQIVGDAGIYIDPTHSSEYAVGIRKALRSNLREKAYKQSEQFDWKLIVQKYEKLLTSV